MRCGRRALFPRPRLMPPREEDEEEFTEDVGGRNIEVVFQRGDGNVAIDLGGFLAV